MFSSHVTGPLFTTFVLAVILLAAAPAPADDANKAEVPQIDAAALATMVQSFDESFSRQRALARTRTEKRGLDC